MGSLEHLAAGQMNVVKAGPKTTVQDLGRSGYQHLGISPGGVADRHAACWSNHLVGNSSGAAVLEISLGQSEFRFAADCLIAVCGADCDVRINGRRAGNWQNHWLRRGDTLSFGASRSGNHGYLAIGGGFQCSPVFGSCASDARAKLGPNQGAPLSSGAILNFPITQRSRIPGRAVPYRYRRNYRELLTLRLLPSQQYRQLSHHDIQTLLNATYKVGVESDKMGTRLIGAPIVMSDSTQSGYSEGIGAGAVQVPPDGQPIILGREHQTIGGYARLGTIYQVDLDRLAQLPPGAEVRFSIGSLNDAQLRLRQHQDFFNY